MWANKYSTTDNVVNMSKYLRLLSFFFAARNISSALQACRGFVEFWWSAEAESTAAEKEWIPL